MLDLRMRFSGFPVTKRLRMLRILKQVMGFRLEELSIQFSRIFMRGVLVLFGFANRSIGEKDEVDGSSLEDKESCYK